MLKDVKLPRLENGLVEHFDAACGPTLHHVIPLSPHADRIWMGDYLPENLVEVHRWWESQPNAALVVAIHGIDLGAGGEEPFPATIAARETLTRQKIAELLHCDFLRPEVLDEPRAFSSVGCFYGTEEVGINKQGWAEVVQRVARLVTPGGYLFLAVLVKPIPTPLLLLTSSSSTPGRLSDKERRRSGH